MGLIRGHLLVGDELVKAGLWVEALPHFHHPVEELYAWLSVRLRGQGARQFDGPLKALAQTVQAKNAPAYEKALNAIASSLERGPGKSDVEWVSSLATTQAKWIRDVTAAAGLETVSTR